MGVFSLTGVGAFVARVHEIVQNCRRENRLLFRMILNSEAAVIYPQAAKVERRFCSCGGVFIALFAPVLLPL
jgi:hypothetical protein